MRDGEQYEDLDFVIADFPHDPISSAMPAEIPGWCGGSGSGHDFGVGRALGEGAWRQASSTGHPRALSRHRFEARMECDERR
jgi:hypothetical protein